VTNLDWDAIGGKDLFVLFSSFCTTGTIEKVEVYPSLFGLEQMKRDTMYGPPKELFADTAERSQIKRKRRKGDAEFQEDDENFQLDENDNEANLARLRKYEINKMKYFYAIVTCNKRSTAAKIYEEYNGFEFELTSLKLSMSYVAKGQEFPQKVKEVCTEVPSTYNFDPNRVSRALNHSTVKLTWDQTDPTRNHRLSTNYKKLTSTDFKKRMRDDEEVEAYNGLVASDSDESSDENEDDKEKKQERIEEMRRKLLGGDSESDADINENEMLDVNFGIGFTENIAETLMDKKAEKEKDQDRTEFEKWQEKRASRKRDKKE
jgi:hypothetical protein